MTDPDHTMTNIDKYKLMLISTITDPDTIMTEPDKIQWLNLINDWNCNEIIEFII